jgi:hypothetical protein
MSFRTILVPVEQHDLMNSTLETALCLAQKFDSYIEGFALRGAIPAAYQWPMPGDTRIGAGYCRKCETNPRPLRDLHARSWCAVWGSYIGAIKQVAGRYP